MSLFYLEVQKRIPESRPLLEKIILNCLLLHFSEKPSEIILFREETPIFAIGMFMEDGGDETDRLIFLLHLL